MLLFLLLILILLLLPLLPPLSWSSRTVLRLKVHQLYASSSCCFPPCSLLSNCSTTWSASSLSTSRQQGRQQYCFYSYYSCCFSPCSLLSNCSTAWSASSVSTTEQQGRQYGTAFIPATPAASHPAHSYPTAPLLEVLLLWALLSSKDGRRWAGAADRWCGRTCSKMSAPSADCSSVAGCLPYPPAPVCTPEMEVKKKIFTKVKSQKSADYSKNVDFSQISDFLVP